MTTATAPTQLDEDNPWPGLQFFEESAHAFFFGRDREIQSLLDHVLEAPVTVLYGRSGLGKSSLLQAGLFPVLRERNFLPIHVRFELKAGAAELSRQLQRSVHDSIRAQVPGAVLPSDEESVWEYLHRADFELWSAQNYPLTPVIVLDQFEELFTLGKQVPGLVDDFRDELGDLAENRIPTDQCTRIDKDAAVAERFNLRSRKYKLLISLREDFLPDLEGWCRLIPALGRSRVRLLPLRVNDALDAVHKPAANLMTKELAGQVVRIIAGQELHRGRAPVSPDAGRPGNQLNSLNRVEVEPALLSLFCRELNEKRKRSGQDRFDARLLEHAERDVLSNFYESCVRDLRPQVAVFIEEKLITESGFRDNYVRADAVPAHLTQQELDELIGSRLVRLEDRYGAQRIELTHDVLTGVVLEHRDLRRAQEKVAEQAEQERQAAAQREAELKERHQAAEALAAREQAHATDLRKRSRILRRVLVVTAIIAVIAVVAAVAAGYFLWTAKQAEKQAQARTREATALRLASEGQAMFAGLRPGGEVRALQELLASQRELQELSASQRVASTADPGTLFKAVFTRRNMLKVIPASDGVWGVAVSPDGRRIVAGSGDGTLSLWAVDTGLPIGRPMIGHAQTVWSVAFSPDGRRIASASEDKTVRIWDADTGQPLGPPLTGNDWVNSVAFSPDGHRIASASGKAVRIWDADTGQPVGPPLTGHTDWVRSVAFSPDGHRIASASDDKTVQLWDAYTGQPIGQPLTRHTGAVTSVAFSPDGHRIASASADKTVQIWDADTGQPLGPPLPGHTERVRSVAFSPDGHRIASASDDKTVRIWDADTGEPIGAPITGHKNRVSGVAFSLDGRYIVSGSTDKTVRLWDADIGPPDGAPIQNGNRAVALSPNGRYIVSGSTDNTVQLWDAGTGKPAAPPFATSDQVESLAFSPDGRRILALSADGMLRLWDTDTRQSIGQPAALENPRDLNNVAFSADGHRIASCCSSDGVLHLWDAGTRQLIRDLKTDGSPALAFSPDGHRIAASYGGSVRLWDADTGQPGRRFSGPSTSVTSVAFSPDGHRIVAGALKYPDSMLQLWNADTGQPLGPPLIGHDGVVTAVAFSPDGHFIVSGGVDHTVRLWNADTGQPIGQPLTGHDDPVTGVAFSADGHLIVSADDHTLRLWPGPAAWRDALCAKVTQNMSRKQWHDWVGHIGYTTQCDTLPIASDEGPSGQIELPFHGLDHPQAITVDTAGNVYVADTGNNRVVKLAAGATTMTQLPFTALKEPVGVAVDRAGAVYVVDQNNRVLKLPPDSASAVQLPFTGPNAPKLPGDVAVDAPGNVYVVDMGNRRVLKLAVGSTTPTALPFADIRVPNTIAVDTTGNVYVTDIDTDTGNNRLLELPAGTTAPSELPCDGLYGAGGVAVDTAGNLYLASSNSNHVLELPKGRPAPSALNFTELSEPNAVAVDSKGTVYVTDAGNNRVIKLPPQS